MHGLIFRRRTQRRGRLRSAPGIPFWGTRPYRMLRDATRTAERAIQEYEIGKVQTIRSSETKGGTNTGVSILFDRYGGKLIEDLIDRRLVVIEELLGEIETSHGIKGLTDPTQG